MKAMIFNTFGPPDVLYYEDVPDPDPAPGPGDLLI
jgi:NADPH:quinone reductase-like Zn-dependent oxidoreductase|tara:strand:+ start:481 stop:585 length:105 start_codon:yes stop_codon:yes gene_type:complete